MSSCLGTVNLQVHRWFVPISLRPVLGNVAAYVRATQAAFTNPPATQEMPVQPLGWENPLEKEKAIHSSILVGNFHGEGSLAGYSPWGLKES